LLRERPIGEALGQTPTHRNRAPGSAVRRSRQPVEVPSVPVLVQAQAAQVGHHTTALGLADVEQLLKLLDRLVDAGKSVIVIEHHLAVMARADWIIDLGPGAGHDGGRLVFEGTPADLVAARSTLTGEHLAKYVGA
jgi:energy-coupling factor transporter ATP-binding protein EcfA2